MIDDRESLQDGFARFVTAARELEASYGQLKQRAEAVDLELQRTNLALEQSLAEREAVFAALPIGLVALRGDGSVGSRNVEAERLLASARQHAVELCDAGEGETSFGDMTVRVRRIALADGELLLLEDRSRLEALEQKVRRLDRLAGLSELALGVAHEIKNPLNGVLGFASLLERSDDPATMRRYAGKIRSGVQIVDDIVKALLGFARPADQPARTDRLVDVVERVAVHAGLPRARWRIDGDVDALVEADALGRVLANLFLNAIEACPAATLRLRATLRQRHLELIVEDDGPGVPMELSRTLFEPFVSSKRGGTGLGLALSVRVLSFLGGELELDNPGEPGARFRIRLPALVPGKLSQEAPA